MPGGALRQVLLVAPFFAPHPRVGALRAFRLATHLPDEGYQPTVVHLAAPGLELTSFQRRRLERVRTISLKLPPGVRASPPATSSRGASTPPGSQQEPSNRSAPPGKFGRLLQRVNQHVDAHVPIDGWLPVLGAHSPGLLRRLRSSHFDLLWSTADPWSSHLLAGLLSRQLDCPWVADFRDPWSLCGVRTQGRARWARRLDAKAERWILERAAQVTFTARTTQSQYAEAYPTLQGKLVTVENGFDPSALAAYPPRASSALQRSEGRFRALFLGRFRALSSLERWLPVLGSLPAEQARRLTLAAVGPLTPADSARLAETCQGVQYEALPPVPHEALGAVLQRADLLLLSTSPGRGQIIPAKLWDYLPARAPILSICENEEIAEVLTRTRRGQQLSLSSAGRFLGQSIEAWARDRKDPPEPDWDQVERFSAPAQTARWARLFDALLEATARARRDPSA